MKPGLETLRSLPFVGDADKDLLIRLKDLALLARLGPDEILFRNGERPEEISILLAGAVASTITRSEGTEAIVDVLEPPRAIGLSALLDAPAIAGARTMTSVRLVVLPAAPLRAMLAEEAALATALLLAAVSEAQALTNSVCQLRLLTAPQRLASYLLGLVTDPAMNPARLVLPIRKHLLAARIGCTPENLSRTIAALRPLGVDTRGAGVVIRDLARLRAYAGLAGVDETPRAAAPRQPPSAAPSEAPIRGRAQIGRR